MTTTPRRRRAARAIVARCGQQNCPRGLLYGSEHPDRRAAPGCVEIVERALDRGGDHLATHAKGLRDWCAANQVELVFTPTYASWAIPIEAHFGPLRRPLREHALMSETFTPPAWRIERGLRIESRS